MNNFVPLAVTLRPLTLADFIGQEHLVGPGKPLRLVIENKGLSAGRQGLFSMIFWGPPGVGKTTLARIIAHESGMEIYELSAVSAGKDEIKKIVKNKTPLYPKILFLDEIHRFNKAQQDYLLPFVETGELILIGATTENPSFEIIPPLLSRCRVFIFNELNEKDLNKIIDRIEKKLFGDKGDLIDKPARDWLINMANGDARQLITIAENTFTFYHQINVRTLMAALQNKFLRFDKKGEEYYNLISAFIKSMRAGDVDAALYYLARMVDAGQDPLYIARRMVVFASEDVASPTALIVANAVFQACQQIGYPECQENLAAGTVYLSLAKKDRRAYDAYMKALTDVKQYGNLQIPLKIRNPVTKLMKDLGYGRGYEKYDKTSYLPDKLKGKRYFK